MAVVRVVSNDENGICIEKVRRGINVPPQIAHFHPYYEIGYLLSGKRAMTVNDAIYTMDKGDFIVISASELHRGNHVENHMCTIDWIGLYVSKEAMQPFFDSIGEEAAKEFLEKRHIKVPASKREYIEELLKKMLYEQEGIDDVSKVLSRSYLLEILAFIYRCQKSGEVGNLVLDEEDKIIADAVEYIFNNYSTNITLDMIADKFCMSKSYFSKRFKAVTGFGFKEYLISVRLKAASDRLLMTNDKITDIALDCGFSDSNYFGDAFKKAKGVSPYKYRKNAGAL